MVGERTNVTGSPVPQADLAGDYEDALSVARQQVEGGAQMLDVNMDEGMLDCEKAMTAIPESHRRRARHRTRADHGRQLEMGRDRGRPQMHTGQVHRQLHIHEGRRGKIPRAGRDMRYGASVIVMAFDENGQADTAKTKVEIASVLTTYSPAGGLPPEDIIFDPNIFAVATGIEEHNNYGVDFIEATRLIKQRCRRRKSRAE